ncbi:MAG: efflux RND transporter periplasmic adaptor subunit [Treponema sp.]|jgi:HlyD family secretion protein|nr:efflux RND transporter periplasmic adaptor subunit [Treponema sp.]
MRLNNRPLFFPAVGFCLLLSAGCGSGKAGGVKDYEFTAISRGILEKTVSAAGSLKPVATVNVLARMSGKVEKIHVDYNDVIRKGDVLAELNTDMLRLQREQQAAAVVKARANYELQFLNYRNQEKLAEKNLISEYELKTGKTTLDVQSAELAAAEASLRAIETEINQYAFIVSPIDGIVLERNISEGDTVVEGSSSNSTSLFTLAENLEEMQIEAGVGELDISGIRRGQGVRFTLEALPGKTFSGVVETIRLMPAVQDNVVSYTVIVNVDNSGGSLLPGMTCAVEFIEERNEGVLLVPNAALRYQPTALTEEAIADMVFAASLRGMSGEAKQLALGQAAEQRKAAAKARSQGGNAAASSQARSGLTGLMTGGSSRGPGMGPGMGPPPGNPGGAENRNAGGSGASLSGPPSPSPPKPLWYINGEGKLDCLLVTAGISDGSRTEIRLWGGGDEPGGLEGVPVILREKV